MSHTELAILWARWNGQRGTAKQITPIMKQLSVADLERMLSERGVVLPQTVRMVCRNGMTMVLDECEHIDFADTLDGRRCLKCEFEITAAEMVGAE